jgi:hypothetical protein
MTTLNASLVDGPITIPIYGEPDENGAPTITGYVSGVHFNVARSALTPALEAYEVTPDPSTPARIWAGDVRREDGTWGLTAFLKFDTQAQAEAALTAAGLAVIEAAE